MTALRVVGSAAVVGFSELVATFSARTWLAVWLPRIFFQVAFFALLGRLAGDVARADAILLGNAVAVVALDAMFVTTTAATERFQATFPLLVAAPARLGLVYLGRGLHWWCAGVISSVLALAVSAVVFDASWPWWTGLTALPLLALIGLSAYCYACVVASWALRNVKFRTLYPEVAFLLLIAFCGVNVPVSFWPEPVWAVAQVLPLTHGLDAVRGFVGDGPVLVPVLLEAAVCVGWALVALLSFERVAARGRRDGSIGFTS